VPLRLRLALASWRRADEVEGLASRMSVSPSRDDWAGEAPSTSLDESERTRVAVAGLSGLRAGDEDEVEAGLELRSAVVLAVEGHAELADCELDGAAVGAEGRE